MPNKQNENKFLKTLLEHLQSLDGSPKLEDVCKYLGIKPDSFKKNFPAPSEETPLEPFPKKLIQQLYFGFKIPYSKFLLSETELTAFLQKKGLSEDEISEKLYTKEEDLFTKWGVMPNDVVVFHHLDYSTKMTKSREEQFKDKYLSLYRKHFPKPGNLYGIYEYLGKGNIDFPIYLGAYGEANDEVFKILEKAIAKAENKIIYSRYIALPYGWRGKEKSKPSFSESAQEALKICSLALFIHICRSMKKFQESKHQSVRFYIVPEPWRPYHFGLVTNKTESYIFTELFRYSEKGGLIPDQISIESVQSPRTKILLDLYKRSMERFSRENKKAYFQSIEDFRKEFEAVYQRVVVDENTDYKELVRLMNQKKKALDTIFPPEVKASHNHTNSIITDDLKLNK